MPALPKVTPPLPSERARRAQLAEHQVGDSDSPSRAQGWRSRGYLPHFDRPGLIQAITFRLANAMPVERRAEWELFSKIEDDAARRQKIEDYLDAGHGSCVLRDNCVAQLVETALLFFDGQRYRLLAWVVMPNHVHVIIEPMPDHSLGSILHSWKSYTANEVNKLLLRTGTLWEPEYHDRFIRDERHLKSAINYVHENPVKARLVKQAELWPWSSVRLASQSPAGRMPALQGSPSSGSAGILPAAALRNDTKSIRFQSPIQ